MATAKKTAAPAAAEPKNSHHFNLGQAVGLALLGLAAYHQQDAAPGGPKTLLEPETTAEYLKGVLSLFPQK